jgi:hypothetical protein
MKKKDQLLTREQVGGIVKMLRLTTDREFDCRECLQHVSEFAEAQLAQSPANDVLAKVEQHLALCPECAEEFVALMKILQAAQ